MLRIIYGACDSSKSEYLYSLAIDSISSGSVFLIVPEQAALSAEKRIYELSEDSSSLGLEVLNFERLAETVFRKCGFLSYNYINDSAKKLLLRKAMTDIKPALSEYGAWTEDESFISNMLAQITEFKHSKVSPETLARVSTSLSANEEESNAKLIKRLDDISLIYAAYNTLVGEHFDDRGDDLSKCSELILSSAPFKRASFFFDEFNGFTVQQYDVISALLKTGNEVYVTLCHPGIPFESAEGAEIYTYTYETEASLIKLAEDIGCEVHKTVFDDSIKFTSPDLAYICKHFSLVGKQKSEGKPDGSVRAISCADIFDECETCAALIAEDVRQGLRYKDITIITRDVDRYKGIIDAVLERHSIPVYFSSKTDITEKSLVRFIFSAFAICSVRTDYTDVITHMRCGLTKLDERECDLLEAYASTWRIKGKAWWDPDGFKMNPRGYVPFSEDDQKHLDEINSIVLSLMSGLEALKSSLHSSKTVREYSAAVYEYMKLSGVTEKLARRSVIMKSRGEDVLSKEEAGLWKALCSALDVLCTTVGELECETDTYLSLLKLVLNDTEVGTIPQTNDAVTVGDASLMRADSVRHTYLIGCSEGLFPKSVTEPALLSRKDRLALKDNNIKGMEFDPALEASMELFWFYRAATSPSDRLTMTYSRSEGNEEQFPSSAFMRICNMLDGILINSAEIDVSKRIISAGSFAEYAPYLKACGYENELDKLLDEDESLKEAVLHDEAPLIANEETVSKENVSSVFKGDLHLSQTATDLFVGCPFAFHCKYSLGLKEANSSEIQKTDTGTLIHSILESFVRGANEDGLFDAEEIDVNEISKRIGEITERQSSLIMEFTPENKKSRVSHMLKRLSEITTYTAINLTDEFSQSGFKPTFFELPINERDPNGIMPIKLTLEDGSYVVLRGISDRVDTMVKGGKLYVRVVDYKSSAKLFSLESISLGLNLQLLIYLFSIWVNAGEAFKLASGALADAEIVPAGAEYLCSSPDKISSDKGTCNDNIADLLSKSFKRSGLYLADREIIMEMDRELSSKFVPVKEKLEGSKECTLMSLQELDTLKDEVSGILTEIGNSIKSGHASATPLGKLSSANRNYTQCEYCKMKFVCKKAEHDTVVTFEEE